MTKEQLVDHLLTEIRDLGKSVSSIGIDVAKMGDKVENLQIKIGTYNGLIEKLNECAVLIKDNTELAQSNAKQITKQQAEKSKVRWLWYSTIVAGGIALGYAVIKYVLIGG